MVYSITGPEKLEYLKDYINKTREKQNFKIVVDVGGVKDSYLFLKELLPAAKIYSLNNYDKHLEGCENRLLVNVDKENFGLAEESVDLIIALDIIEHLMNPDNLLENCKKCLKKNGILILSTPNMASLFNRIFLLMGFSFSNYHPSKYKTGNPFFKIKNADPLWNQFAHKSVFTMKALKELVKEIYKFEIIKIKGYSYVNYMEGTGDSTFWRVRKFLNYIIPTGLKEGTFIIGKKV